MVIFGLLTYFGLYVAYGFGGLMWLFPVFAGVAFFTAFAKMMRGRNVRREIEAREQQMGYAADLNELPPDRG